MNRPWIGYQNTQKYIECQLVSALNAYYYLTGDQIPIGSEGYEELVDLTNGRDIACLCMSPLYERLGIKVIKTFDSHKEFINNLVFPLEKIVFGVLHSVLIIDWEPHNKRLRITNFGATDSEGWVSEELFFQSIRVKDENYGSYKLFDLV